MKLYSVHCGFYDREAGDGIYESHINFFVAAESFGDAKQKAKQDARFKKMKMHIDGLQELNTVNGYDITLSPSKNNETSDAVVSMEYDQIGKLPSPSNYA